MTPEERAHARIVALITGRFGPVNGETDDARSLTGTYNEITRRIAREAVEEERRACAEVARMSLHAVIKTGNDAGPEFRDITSAGAAVVQSIIDAIESRAAPTTESE